MTIWLPLLLAATASAPNDLAVLETTSAGPSTDDLARLLTTSLVTAFDRSQRYGAVVTKTDIEARIELDRIVETLNECTSEACREALQDRFRALGASFQTRYFAASRIGRVGSEYVLSVSVINSATLVPLGRHEIRASEPADVLNALDELVRVATGLPPPQATLSLSAAFAVTSARSSAYVANGLSYGARDVAVGAQLELGWNFGESIGVRKSWLWVAGSWAGAGPASIVGIDAGLRKSFELGAFEVGGAAAFGLRFRSLDTRGTTLNDGPVDPADPSMGFIEPDSLSQHVWGGRVAADVSVPLWSWARIRMYLGLQHYAPGGSWTLPSGRQAAVDYKVDERGFLGAIALEGRI